MLNDTIVAVSTPLGESGIGIVRMSGRNSLSIVARMFLRRDGRGIFDFPDHSINHGWIVDPCSKEIIDEVLITILKGPKTYTKEDMIEINCHGGIIALNHTMDLAISLGARPALPGEFTKRAYLNGRIDLAQAEAVLDIIRARTEQGFLYAVRRLRGSIRTTTAGIREQIMGILSEIEAGIEFEDQISRDEGLPLEGIDSLVIQIQEIISRYEALRHREEGIRIAICGKTNVGKSSILNAVYGEDRIITSNIPGTTRDCVQVDILLDGIIFHVMDTAGIKKEKGRLDQLCAQKTHEELQKSDLILAVFDLSRRISTDDIRLVQWLEDRRRDIIWVGNKNDLRRSIDMNALKAMIQDKALIEISAKKRKGLDLLMNEIKLRKGVLTGSVTDGALINKRISEHLKNISNALGRVKELHKERIGEEIIAEELRHALQELDNIEGRGANEELIDSIFSKFCIGK